MNLLSKSQSNTRSASADYGTLDLDKIYKRIASEDQQFPNYMIRLYPPEGVDNSLEYLVMIGTDYGFRGYILQYQTTPEHINTIKDPTIYTGYINILNMKRGLLAKNYFVDGLDAEVPENPNGRALYENCECSYAYGQLIVHSGLSADAIAIGINCTCCEQSQLSDPGIETGGESIGDPLPSIYSPTDPDSGGGGSGDGEGETVPVDNIGTEKEVGCSIRGYVKDSDGQCISEEEYIIGEIEKKLEDNPFALLDIDCDQIENWQELAQHIPSQDVINKLISVDDNTVGDVNIQDIADANGAIVNMDYFPVTISTLPNDPITKMPLSADDFLNHIRTNINEFIDTQYSNFNPSTITGFDEALLWESNNPVGAIIHINIPTAGDGSVICSEHTSSNWIFTTIEVPWWPWPGFDGEHPVSGNRAFGYISNRDRSFTFFTRGVDRMTDPIEADLIEGLSDNPFSEPDKLWNSFTQGIHDFVEVNGGSSTKPVKEDNKINRINYDLIKAVLDGKRPISDFGCN